MKRTSVVLCAAALSSAPVHAQCPWQPGQQLLPDTGYGAAPHYFARSVSLDGDRVLIGAPGLEGEPGEAFVFEHDGALWHQVVVVAPGDGSFGDEFGASAALSGDTAIVGAPDAGEGVAYVFERIAGTWVEAAKLDALPSEDAEFGCAVALEGDRAAVGAPDAMSVFVYERTGGVWTLDAVLQTDPPTGGFGEDVRLDGDRIAVGAPESDSAFLFSRAAGVWTLEASFQGVPGAEFGAAVALDGGQLFVGAPGVASESGAVHTFGLYATDWTATGTIEPGVAASGARFGESIAVDHGSALIGAPADGEGFGSCFQFQQLGGEWVEVEKIEPSLGADEYNFGTAIDLDAGVAMVNIGLDQAGVLGQYAGSLYEYGTSLGDCPELSAYPGWVSLTDGGNQTLSIETDPAYAFHPYVVLGSMSGTEPGIPLPAGVIPLNVDAYTLLSATSANTAPFVGTFGLLSGEARGSAAISIPPGAAPALAGWILHHAFVVLDPATLGAEHSDNAVSLQLLP